MKGEMQMSTRVAFVILLATMASGTGCWSHHQGVEVRTLESDTPQEIQGVPCGRSVRVDQDDRLLSCTLSRDAELGEARLPEGTWIRFRPEGTIDYCFLPGDTRVQGYLCRGKGHSYMTTFYPSGRLRLCWLAEDEEIQGIPCVRATTGGEVFGRLAGRGGPGAVFFENGNLQSCKLARGIVIDDKKYKGGRRITLDEEGNIVD
jgi:hypothetical protein